MLNGNFNETCTWKEEAYPRWVRIRTIVDSGAAQTVVPPSMAPGVTIEESEMSKRGQSFTAANAGNNLNHGQQSLRITTNEWKAGRTLAQVGDVNRPLMAVSQVCDQGNYVLFTSQGGSVLILYDGEWIDFDRVHDTYMMEWWMTVEDVNGQSRKAPGHSESTCDGLRSFKDMVKEGSGFDRQGR